MIDNLIKEIETLLKIHWHMDAKLYRIECNSEFEPHGRASETWEIVYTVTLPDTEFFYKLTDGYHKSDSKIIGPVFEHKTLVGALTAARDYLVLSSAKTEVVTND